MPPDAEPEGKFLGVSPGARRVRRECRRAAQVDCPVLIVGESGVGKELVAREIHAASRRSRRPFVTVNCAAIPDTLIETELFGHVAGAFTDARGRRRGAFELANRGTLFLDEIGDLSPTAQPKLLRAIELGEVRPVGGESVRKIDLRIVAATNQDLDLERSEGRFRADLYFRIDILEIRIPPLRDRSEDIPLLAESFLRMIAQRNGQRFENMTPKAVELLREHTWPGNARELRGVLERAMALETGGVLDTGTLLMKPDSHPGLTLRELYLSTWREAHRKFRAAYLRELLRRTKGGVVEAAKLAGLSPRAIYKNIRMLGLRETPRDRRPTDVRASR